jgi:hypothetical protein
MDATEFFNLAALVCKTFVGTNSSFVAYKLNLTVQIF